ncbi:glycine C-acetyltransferase [bacterium A37T11]|nr:glycine C-acetyltransferase [bacterium A37T11]
MSGTPVVNILHCQLIAIDLIDEEPGWRTKLWDNIRQLKKGLDSLGLDTGTTASAIIPVKIGDPILNAQVCTLLMEAGIYTNQINYPAVAKKDARIRMSVMATHTSAHINKVLNAWEWIIKKGKVKRKD